ncbi:hypothetical protein [Butyrivibrio sp. FCS006]|uniref:hypothetical protein n=1 Tax=Butyrivibrio sp. FCS006 TaxID=1280684 RepID=UPI0003F7872D|nr:hypothetical protein [Butyrivibrio sp. FCS006]
MKNTRMVKLLALGISLTLLLQPIAAFAEEGEPIAEPAVVEAAPQMNDAVEEKVEAAEAAVEQALPDNEVAQPTTDKYLENTETALENIDNTIEELDELNDAAQDKIDDYNDAVEDAKESTGDFLQEVGETLPQAGGAVIGTFVDAVGAYQDANTVESMAGETYETQAEAEAAKTQATGIAAEAQAKADDAAQLVEDLGEKLEDAKEAKDQAKADLDEAEKALTDANRAVFDAEIELLKIQNKYGYNSMFFNPESSITWLHGSSDVASALNNAQAAVAEANRLKGIAEQNVTDKQNAYDEADGAYNKAVQDKKDAEDSLADAQAALDDAKALEALIKKVNGIEQDERDTWNTYKNYYDYGGRSAALIDQADKDLAKALVEYKLFGNEIISVNKGSSNNKFVVTYKDKDGNTKTDKFLYEVEDKTYIVDGHKSVHWIKIKKKVSGNYVEYYKEIDYYKTDKNSADGKVDEAQGVIDGLNKLINVDLSELDQARQNAYSEIGTAQGAKEAAERKLAAVEDAQKAVIDAAKALKNLKAKEFVSAQALSAVRNQYNSALSGYNLAKGAYFIAAINAGIAQDEANRALAALEEGFDYLIPTPTPGPGPSGEPTGEPTGDTTPDDTTDYIPVAPIAVTPAPAAPAPQQAVLGATRTRSGAAATAVEAGEGEEEKKATPAVEKKQEEKKEETKPAVAIEEEETAKAAAPIATQTPFPWWVLIILAAITALSIEEYVRRRNAKANAQG